MVMRCWWFMMHCSDQQKLLDISTVFSPPIKSVVSFLIIDKDTLLEASYIIVHFSRGELFLFGLTAVAVRCTSFDTFFVALICSIVLYFLCVSFFPLTLCHISSFSVAFAFLSCPCTLQMKMRMSSATRGPTSYSWTIRFRVSSFMHTFLRTSSLFVCCYQIVCTRCFTSTDAHTRYPCSYSASIQCCMYNQSYIGEAVL